MEPSLIPPSGHFKCVGFEVSSGRGHAAHLDLVFPSCLLLITPSRMSWPRDGIGLPHFLQRGCFLQQPKEGNMHGEKVECWNMHQEVP